MANLANGNTKTAGKFNARAVFAFHTASASRSLRNGDKAGMRRAIENMRLTRIQSGIYKAGDFHAARLV